MDILNRSATAFSAQVRVGIASSSSKLSASLASLAFTAASGNPLPVVPDESASAPVAGARHPLPATTKERGTMNNQIARPVFPLKKTRLFNVALLLVCVLSVQASFAQDGGDAPADSLVSISFSDGTLVEGTIIQETETHILVETLAGLEVKVPRSSVVAIQKRLAGAFARPDPNYTRLMFAPTGRPLRRGDGYFFSHWVFFPGVAYSFTDRLGVAAGLSVIPGFGLDEQILSLAPKVGLYDSGDLSLSAGVLYMNFANEGAGGMAFVVGTKGSPNKSFTCGIGLGYIAEEGESVDLAEHPVLLLGGNIRLSESTALVSEKLDHHRPRSRA